MIRALLLFIGLLVGNSVACAEDIVLLGDSQVGGFGPRLSRRLRDEGHHVRIVYRNGWTTERYLAEGRVRALVQGADLVVVCLGGNNRQSEAADYQSTLVEMVRQIRLAQVAQVVWLGPAYSTNPRRQARKQHTEEMLRPALAALGVTFVSTWEATQDFPLRQDQTHFTRIGYSRWARQLFDQVTMALGTSE